MISRNSRERERHRPAAVHRVQSDELWVRRSAVSGYLSLAGAAAPVPASPAGNNGSGRRLSTRLGGGTDGGRCRRAPLRRARSCIPLGQSLSLLPLCRELWPAPPRPSPIFHFQDFGAQPEMSGGDET